MASPGVVVRCSAFAVAAALDYLGRSVFRIAIAISRLEQGTEDAVTFRYRGLCG
jgi:hypothetical protein